MMLSNILSNEGYSDETIRDVSIHMNVAETYLWSKLSDKEVLNIEFLRRHLIDSLVVDFYAESLGLVIEIDCSHHFELEQRSKDAERTAALQRVGCRVLRFTNTDVLGDIDGVIAEIEALVQQSVN